MGWMFYYIDQPRIQSFPTGFEDTGIGVFWLQLALDNKGTEVGSSNQETSPSAGKNTEVVSVSCHVWKCVPTATSCGVDISEVPERHLLPQMSYQ